jgi:hypothetical protein
MTTKFIIQEYHFRTNSSSFLKTNRAQKKLNSVNSFIILLALTDLSFHKEINKVKLNSFGSINKSAIDKPPLLNKNDLIVKSKNSTL